MTKQFQVLFHFIGLLLLINPVFLFSQEKYTNYQLPPVFDLFADLKPHGQKAWIPSSSLQVSEDEDAYSAAYFPDGQNVIVGLNNGKTGGSVSRWNINDKKKTWSQKPFQSDQLGKYPAIRYVNVSPNGRHVSAIPYFRQQDKDIKMAILNGNDGRLNKIFKIKSWHPVCKGIRNGQSVMLQPWLAKFSRDSKSVIVYYKNQYGANYESQAGRCLVVTDRWIIKWNLFTGKKLWHYHLKTDAIPEMKVPEHACTTRWNMDISPDGKTVATGNCNGEVFLINSETGELKKKIFTFLRESLKYKLPGTYRIQNLKYHPKENSLYIVVSDAGRKGLLIRLDLDKGHFPNHMLTGQTDDIPDIEFSPDGRIMAAGYSRIYAWDLKNKYAIMSLSGHFMKINPRYREIMAVSARDLYFIHVRTRKTYSLKPGWNRIGLWVKSHTGFHIKAKSGSFNMDLNVMANDNRARAYDYKDYIYSGENFQKEGSLFLKPVGKSDMQVSILGGLKLNDFRTGGISSRKNLPLWGNYPIVAEYGGRVGVNKYSPSGKVDIFDPNQKPKELQIGDLDWKQYKTTKEKANEQLQYGLDTNRPAMVLAAFKAGANPDLKSQINIPLLTYAVDYKPVFVKLFIKYGANVNGRSGIGGTALIQSAWRKRFENMKILLKHGANVNDQADNGTSALIMSARVCSLEGIKILIQAGADKSLKNKDGLTALELSKRRCNYHSRKKFEEYLK